MLQNFLRYFKDIYKNELSIFIYLNAIFLYIPWTANGLFNPAEINYTLLVVFLLLNIIFVTPDFKMLLTSNISIALIFYIIAGLLFSIFSESIFDALKKVLILSLTMVLFFVYIYHKLDKKYIVNMLTSMAIVGLFVIWSIFFKLDGEVYFAYNHVIQRNVFSLETGINIFIILPLFLISIFTYYKIINQSKIMLLLLVSALFAYVAIVFNNPVRISLFFILLYLFFIQRKFFLLITAVLSLIILFNYESIEFLSYLVNKTQNESRLGFFKDVAAWSKGDIYIGNGFGVTKEWARDHPYTILDIHSIVLFYLETRLVGVVAMFTIIFSLIMEYKKNFDSNFLQYYCSDNKVFMRDFSIYMLPLALILTLLPNVAILGQTSVFEYYFMFFLLTLAYKTSRSINT